MAMYDSSWKTRAQVRATSAKFHFPRLIVYLNISFYGISIGIPLEKRSKLFAKFQDSLDILNQGTGIGLCLCKHLSDLMGCDITLDESFDSGVPGFPGTRFIVDLNTPPIHVDRISEEDESNTKEKLSIGPDTSTSLNSITDSSPGNVKLGSSNDGHLPAELAVLFVDDDLVLRKMFSRSLKRVAPEWSVEEAANGETALHLVDEHTYDIIFLDQYMASAQKQLTGSETTRALRAKGVSCQLCGLSANDVEVEFLEAGADSFIFKPFPCKKDELKKELLRILSI